MLYYRGYSIEELVERSSFEEVAYLLIYGRLPNANGLREFRESLGRERELPGFITQAMTALPKQAPPMSVLQSMIALLGVSSPIEDQPRLERTQARAVAVVAKMPTIIAGWDRIRNGNEPLEPDPSTSHAADFLRMLHGETPTEKKASYLDKTLILHADHTFNASTFTARVIASTRASIYAAVSGAIGSLSGELHGGANAKVMRTLQEIGDIERVDEWVKEQLASGKRIMGMGHAIYRTTDPRAKLLKLMADELTAGTEDRKLYEMTERLREATEKEFRRVKKRGLYANVDLYSGSVYHALGIPADTFTAVFSMARTAGWVAHVIEEKNPQPPIKPILYRPTVAYSGQYCGEEGCRYVSIEERA